MQEPHSSGVSGVLTYGIGLLAALSSMSLNEWLMACSLILVILRAIYETHDFIQRRNDRITLLAKQRADTVK